MTAPRISFGPMSRSVFDRPVRRDAARWPDTSWVTSLHGDRRLHTLGPVVPDRAPELVGAWLKCDVQRLAVPTRIDDRGRSAVDARSLDREGMWKLALLLGHELVRPRGERLLRQLDRKLGQLRGHPGSCDGRRLPLRRSWLGRGWGCSGWRLRWDT